MFVEQKICDGFWLMSQKKFIIFVQVEKLGILRFGSDFGVYDV